MDVQDVVKLSRDSFQDYTSSFEEMSSAIEQISASIKNSVKASTQTRQNLQNQNEQLERDFKEITRLIDEFKEMKRILQTLFSQMQVFKEKSTEIFKILSTIQDITDRTNLLALNASIEAARAGEHGKGFSVVAEEITKLAEKIKQSTKSVQNILTDYQ